MSTDICIKEGMFRFDNNEVIIFYDNKDKHLIINSKLPGGKIDIIKNGDFMIKSVLCIKDELNKINNEQFYEKWATSNEGC